MKSLPGSGDNHPVNIRGNHVWLIATYSMRFAIRTGGGLMYFLVFTIVGLMIASAFISPLESLTESLGSNFSVVEAADEISKSTAVKDVVGWVTNSDEEQVDYLLEEKPALFSAILIIFLISVPYVTCLGAFNQTSGDIASKGLRFLLFRTERVNIFLGRFLGVFLFTVISSAAVVLLIAFYIHFKFGIYNFGALAGWSLYGLFSVIILGLPYVAICAWISCKIDSPFGSLTLCLLVTGFSILFLFLARDAIATGMSMEASDLNWIYKLLPTGWKFDLLSHSFGIQLMAILAMLGFTALFLLLGIRSFNKRDL